MLVSLAADLVASLHFAFVVFVVSGGLLVLRWPWLAWLHLPAVAWGASIELLGWICPLTPLENRLRHEAGLAGYEGGFVEHYLVPLLYPASLSRSVQVILGLSVLLINAVLYGSILRRRFRHPL
ncbi:MAG: DUF2784 domain-containing protein [Thermoanaerobaculia bacterium]